MTVAELITVETLTDAEVRKEPRRSALVSVGVDCAIALGIDARSANGNPPTTSEIREARERVAAAINARKVK
jgi:hypothetical protein